MLFDQKFDLSLFLYDTLWNGKHQLTFRLNTDFKSTFSLFCLIVNEENSIKISLFQSFEIKAT